MTHRIGPVKPGPRAAKPITSPPPPPPPVHLIESSDRSKITFILTAYLVLLCEFFLEFYDFLLLQTSGRYLLTSALKSVLFVCYSAKIGRESIQTYAIPVLILLHSVNNLLTIYFSLQDFSSNSFQKYQDLPTSGAVDVEQFTINGNQFLAFANSRNDTDGFNTESFIYKMNNFTEKYSLY